MQSVLSNHHGNPASSTHAFGWYAEELVNIARERVATLINATPQEIVFTSGATEANNLAIKGCFFGSHEQKNFHVISTASEHKAVLEPIDWICKLGAKSSILPVESDGRLSVSRLEEALQENTQFISVIYANNEIGSINDLRALRSVAQSSVHFHTDGTQAVGKIDVDVQALGIDSLSLSAHKMYGPKGIGALYVKGGNANSQLTPLLHGGKHEHGFRAGTLNVAGIVGLGKACELAGTKLAEDTTRIEALSSKLFSELKTQHSDISLNGSEEHRIPGNLNICIPGVDAARLLGKINSKIALSAGSACQSQNAKPSHVLEALGLSIDEQKSSIRIGIGRFNTDEEIEQAANMLSTTIANLR